MRLVYRILMTLAALVAFAVPAHAQSLVRDAETEILLRGYTDPLLIAAGLDPEAVDLYLVGDMEFNAFVTGGQNIFMNTGTIVISDQPNEIKGVLAHEIGHITGAHLARFGDASRSALATFALTLGVGLAAALAGEGRAGAAIMASGSQFATLDMLRYTRAQEAGADQAALGYLEATGQSGRGLVTTFERFRFQEVMSQQRRMEYFRSHPLSSDRVAALRTRVEASPYADVTDSPEEVDALRRVQAKIIGFMVPPAQTFSRYPESDESVPARYARSVAWYKQGNLDRGRAELATLIAEEPANPFFHELEGQMLFESGRIEESIAPYRRAVDLMPESALLRIGLAGSLIAAGGPERLDEAKTHLRFALTEEPDNPLGWYQLSLAHQALGETAQAELATAERAYAVGNTVEAFQFAKRAQEDLEEGTPSWLRAAEIIAVAQPTPQEIREWNRQQRERYPLSAATNFN
ncbi:M48 family peptidase [Marinicauda algicola]|uniref:M48 family peptidase n=1 Tax=Marinicauda algicola TaxID=2029849 RepID=A0A4S2H2A6_9PROT|nr:M48 family metalloprotease [Marinicauda algicola]TGY89603.1 M48 family peptidase [Marinicauda algicola]